MTVNEEWDTAFANLTLTERRCGLKTSSENDHKTETAASLKAQAAGLKAAYENTRKRDTEGCKMGDFDPIKKTWED